MTVPGEGRLPEHKYLKAVRHNKTKENGQRRAFLSASFSYTIDG